MCNLLWINTYPRIKGAVLTIYSKKMPNKQLFSRETFTDIH